MEPYKTNFICYSDSTNIPDRIELEDEINIKPQNGIIKNAHGKLGEIILGIEKPGDSVSLLFKTQLYQDMKLLFNSYGVDATRQFIGKKIIFYEKDDRIIAVSPADNRIYSLMTC